MVSFFAFYFFYCIFNSHFLFALPISNCTDTLNSSGEILANPLPSTIMQLAQHRNPTVAEVRNIKMRLALAEFLHENTGRLRDPRLLTLFQRLAFDRADSAALSELQKWIEVIRKIELDSKILKRLEFEVDHSTLSDDASKSLTDLIASETTREGVFSNGETPFYYTTADFVERLMRMPEVRRFSSMKRIIQIIPPLTYDEAFFILSAIPNDFQQKAFILLKGKIFTPTSMYQRAALLTTLEGLHPAIQQQVFPLEKPARSSRSRTFILGSALAVTTTAALAEGVYLASLETQSSTGTLTNPRSSDFSETFENAKNTAKKFATPEGRGEFLVEFVKTHAKQMTVDDAMHLMKMAHHDLFCDAIGKTYLELLQYKISVEELLRIEGRFHLPENKDQVLIEYIRQNKTTLTLENYHVIAARAALPSNRDRILKLSMERL